MNWDSLDAFWQMGGQGRFVWSAYGVMLGAMLLEALWVRRQLRRTRQTLQASASDASIDLFTPAPVYHPPAAQSAGHNAAEERA